MKYRLCLGAIMLAAVAQAVWWVFLVPIYQSPDEPAHLDYALSIHANKGLIVARHTNFWTLRPSSHPYTEYLRKRTYHADIIFRPSAKMPADYGTPEFYRNLERDAPTSFKLDRPCQLAALYPFGYYAALAVWIEAVRWYDGGIVAMFFGARLFSVVLLSISLLLTHGILRQLGYKPWFCLLVTACIGTFPLTSFVSSYVQPDNLSFTMVSLSFYFALRARAQNFRTGSLCLVGAALGLLLVTKLHFWLCVTPAVLGMIASHLLAKSASPRRWVAAGVCLAAPTLVLGGIWMWTVWGTTNPLAPRDQSLDRLTHTVRFTRQAFDDYFTGTTHLSFWGLFGWLDTPLKFRSGPVTEAINFLVQAATWGLLALTLLRIEQVASRLITVARAGRPKAALRIALSNPVINSYFLFTAFMLLLYVLTSNLFGAQGRNWFPLILPIFLVGLCYAPQALTLKTSRRALSGVLAAGLLLYGVVGNHYARESLRARYFANDSKRTIVETPYTSEPTDCNEMSWSSGAGDGVGNDPYLVYTLDRPRYVQSIHLRLTVTNLDNTPSKSLVFWKNGAQVFVEHERCVPRDLEAGRETTLVIPVNAEISHFRLDPDIKPCHLEIHEIALRQESEESRLHRQTARDARRAKRKSQ